MTETAFDSPNEQQDIETQGPPEDRRTSLEAALTFARADFWCFVELMFPVLHPGQKVIFAPYLGLMATLLMRVDEGKYKRVVINLPPRHMKSMLASVLYPAWLLGRDPTIKIICISYSDDLAHDLSSLTRKVMQSEAYQTIFPGTWLDKSAVDYLRTTRGGYRYTVAVKSHITGFGADIIIIDDPLQPVDAYSENAKQNYRNWFANSVLTRFNNPKRGALILVMHRLSTDDPSADLEQSADFTLRLPLVAEKKESFEINGHMIFRRAPGEPLNTGILDLPQIDKLKTTIPPHVYAAQYQQRPTYGGSGMLSIERFLRYDLNQCPAFELIIQSWDIGATITGNASVCTTWGLVRHAKNRDTVYLVDVQRLRLELPEVLAAIKSADRRDTPALIIIDERGVGMGVYQQLFREGFRHITGSTETSEAIDREGLSGTKPSASKIDRFGKAALEIADGRVLIPDRAPWLESFLNEVAGFPNITDKDQVDSMSQLIANLDRAIYIARDNKCRYFR